MISYQLLPLYGGAGTQALHLAQKLQERGLSVFALTARHNVDLPAQALLMDVPIHRLPVLKSGRLRPLSFSLSATWHLLWHYRSYDVVHIHGAYWRILPLLLAAKLVGKKRIVKMTQMGTDDPLAIRHRRFGSVLLSTMAIADIVVAITDELADSYIQAGLSPERLARIPNGVDTTLFSPVDSETRQALRVMLGIPPTVPVVLFVGAVCWRKGVDLLLTAWQMVQEQFPEAMLVLAGPLRTDPKPYGRPFAEYLRDYIATHLPLQRIRAVGQQTDVQRLYQAADVFVLPSRMEGLPNALLEAMSCALPVVATTVGGAPEVIKNQANGMLVPPGDKDALSNSISHLIRHPKRARRLGQSARRTIMAHFSMDVVVDKYMRLYSSMTNSGKRQ